LRGNAAITQLRGQPEAAGLSGLVRTADLDISLKRPRDRTRHFGFTGRPID
jgi:hypothetical protein